MNVPFLHWTKHLSRFTHKAVIVSKLPAPIMLMQPLILITLQVRSWNHHHTPILRTSIIKCDPSRQLGPTLHYRPFWQILMPGKAASDMTGFVLHLVMPNPEIRLPCQLRNVVFELRILQKLRKRLRCLPNIDDLPDWFSASRERLAIRSG